MFRNKAHNKLDLMGIFSVLFGQFVVCACVPTNALDFSIFRERHGHAHFLKNSFNW